MYHVYVRGINNEFIFNQVREKNYLKRIIRKHLSEYNVEIYAYCIMSNHAHLMIKSEQISELSMFMSKILAEYAAYYNFKWKRNGHVFQNRFKSEIIEESKYFWNCLKYIHMNPVKAKMVSNVLQYRYSSIHDYKNGKSNIIHENALKFYQKRFNGWKELLEFHGVYGDGIFLGTNEEKETRYIEIAWKLIWEIQKENALDNTVEVLEEPELRKDYLKKLKETIKISDSKLKKVYKQIKDNLIA